MAFSFGQSTPAFGAASVPAFSFSAPTATPGVTPAFGAATPAFGATSTPAFGATSTPSLFGAASTPSLFGAASTPAFGATSTPAFGFSSAPTSLFGASPATSLFGGAAPAGGGLFGAAPAGGGLFGGGAAAAPAQQAMPLVTKENAPVTHSTKWDDLSPQAQQYLLELEKVVVAAREDCRQLDGDERLARTAERVGVGNQDIRALSQSVSSLGGTVAADRDAAGALRELTLRLLRSTETAVHTFKRSHAWREAAKAQGAPAAAADALAGPVTLPSVFLRGELSALQAQLAQEARAAADLAQVLRPAGAADGGPDAGALGADDPASSLAALQRAVTATHDVLIATAARLQALDDRTAAVREAWLDRRRRAGDFGDPFAEAERQERTRAPASAKPRRPPPAASPAPSSAQPGQTPAGMPAATPAASPSPGGLFGTVLPQSPAGFGTPVFGDAGLARTASARKSKGRK